jgi:hypothetical protein
LGGPPRKKKKMSRLPGEVGEMRVDGARDDLGPDLAELVDAVVEGLASILWNRFGRNLRINLTVNL